MNVGDFCLVTSGSFINKPGIIVLSIDNQKNDNSFMILIDGELYNIDEDETTCLIVIK